MTIHSPVEIRPAGPDDLPDLLRLLQAKAVFDGCPEALQANVDSLHAAMFTDQPLAYALLAVVDGKPVGMASYFRIFSSFICRPGFWLDDLYIDEACRGQGIGRALMQELCGIAAAAGCGRLDWHVARSNQAGKGFYRAIGAAIFDEQQLVRLDAAAIGALAER